MITLLTYKPAFGTFSASPFCTKAAYLLNMAGVQWDREDLDDPRKMPYAKLPAIRVNGDIIPDSDNIRHWLETHGADFDAGLSDLDRANSRAFIRMVEEHIYFHQVLDRWGDDRVWPVIVETYFDSIPWFLRGFVTNNLRRKVITGCNWQGIGRLSIDDRMARLEPDLRAISARLKESAFLFGDKPTAADASTAAMLGGMRAGPVKTALVQRVCKDETLMAYIDRADAAMG